MFTDGRSRRVVFLAHCLLNQNAISDGTAEVPAAHREILRTVLDARVGVVQLPCPELCCLGLDRGDPKGGERSTPTMPSTANPCFWYSRICQTT